MTDTTEWNLTKEEIEWLDSLPVTEHPGRPRAKGFGGLECRPNRRDISGINNIGVLGRMGFHIVIFSTFGDRVILIWPPGWRDAYIEYRDDLINKKAKEDA